MTVLSNNFILLSSFRKIDQKTFKDITPGLHFTTFVNIHPKSRHFEGRNYIQIGDKSYLVLLFSQSLKRGVDLEKGRGV